MNIVTSNSLHLENNPTPLLLLLLLLIFCPFFTFSLLSVLLPSSPGNKPSLPLSASSPLISVTPPFSHALQPPFFPGCAFNKSVKKCPLPPLRMLPAQVTAKPLTVSIKVVIRLTIRQNSLRERNYNLIAFKNLRNSETTEQQWELWSTNNQRMQQWRTFQGTAKILPNELTANPEIHKKAHWCLGSLMVSLKNFYSKTEARQKLVHATAD